MLLNMMLIIIFCFMSIAFFTILERKMLASFHIRVGPNKTGINGIFQPFYDFIKLFSKKLNFIYKINILFWNLSPLLIFLLFLITLVFFPIKLEIMSFKMNVLLLIFIIGLPTFCLLFCSFFSFSKYSIISSKRCISQVLSYEMGLMMFFIFMIPMLMTLNISMFMQMINMMNINKIMLMLILFIIILSESSRIPFDFIEGESELISGFNIEFSSIYFSLFFIYEYGMMMFFSVLIGLMTSNYLMSFLLFFLYIIIRASFPRFRYDQMMMLFWKTFYPLMICLILFVNFL